MCGYCIEGEAIKCLWDNQFDIDKLANVMKGNKNMSGKDIEEIKSKFNKSAHAKTDEIFEIKIGSKVVWTA